MLESNRTELILLEQLPNSMRGSFAMSELVADVQSVVGRLGARENELRQLRNLVSSQ